MSAASEIELQFANATEAGVADLASTEMHAPDLYNHQQVLTPLADLASIDEAQIEAFHKRGFMAVKSVFSPDRIAAAIDGWEQLVAGDVPGYKGCQFEAAVADRIEELTVAERRLGPILHFQRRDWQICDKDAYRIHDSEHPVTAVPLPVGGCLFFSGLLPHGTPHNHTDMHRRALQFHYYPETTKGTTAEERLAIFGTEGKDVTC